MSLINRTEVANIGLSIIGIDPLGDIDNDQGKVADLCRLHLKNQLEILLEDHRFDFAGSWATLTKSTTVTVPTLWEAGYPLPSDCLRLREIDSLDVDLPEMRFKIMGRHIFLQTDEDTIDVFYTVNNPAIDLWPANFANAVAYGMAVSVATSLSKKADVIQRARMAFKEAEGEAKSKDARESASKENNTPRQIALRSGLARSRYGSTPPPY